MFGGIRRARAVRGGRGEGVGLIRPDITAIHITFCPGDPGPDEFTRVFCYLLKTRGFCEKERMKKL